MNGWHREWMDGGMESAIHSAFVRQAAREGYKTEGWSTGYRKTDHHTVCKELGLSWSVDSGD